MRDLTLTLTLIVITAGACSNGEHVPHPGPAADSGAPGADALEAPEADAITTPVPDADASGMTSDGSTTTGDASADTVAPAARCKLLTPSDRLTFWEPCITPVTQKNAFKDGVPCANGCIQSAGASSAWTVGAATGYADCVIESWVGEQPSFDVLCVFSCDVCS